MTRYKTFPPRWSHIRVPTSDRRAGRAAIALYAPCRPGGLALQRAAWTLTGLVGPAALPGPSRPWDPPVPPEAWAALQEAWRDQVGPHDTMAVYARPQRARVGFAVLLIRDGEALGFARVRPSGGDTLPRERRVLEHLTAAGITAFWHPAVVGLDEVAGWATLLTTALPAALHRPVWEADVGRLSAILREPLAAAVPRSDGCPSDWVPMHGDLTPWNLRRRRGVGTVLLDWEDVAWGPPDADRVLYAATVAALRRSPPGTGSPEAVAFWLDRFSAETARKREAALAHDVIAALQRMS